MTGYSIRKSNQEEILKMPAQTNDNSNFSEYTEKMHRRWHFKLSSIPNIDKQDQMQKQSYKFNNKATNPINQEHPEYTQQCYLRIRKLEETFNYCNYLKIETHQALENKFL